MKALLSIWVCVMMVGCLAVSQVRANDEAPWKETVAEAVDAVSGAEPAGVVADATKTQSLGSALIALMAVLVPSLLANLVQWAKGRKFAATADACMSALAAGSAAGSSVVALWNKPSREAAKETERLAKNFFVVTRQEYEKLKE